MKREGEREAMVLLKMSDSETAAVTMGLITMETVKGLWLRQWGSAGGGAGGASGRGGGGSSSGGGARERRRLEASGRACVAPRAMGRHTAPRDANNRDASKGRLLAK